MKKALSSLATGFTVTMASFLLMSPLSAQLNPEDIFISADEDAFDAGLPVGTQFPPIRALYGGDEITEIDQFMGERGLVFIANRSVDW